MANTDKQSGTGAVTGSAQPVPVNMYEAEEAVVVVAPLPGVMPEDIDLRVEGEALVISASQRTPAVKDYLLHEWHYGPYERRVDLPAGVKGEIQATFGNGQLAVRVLRSGSPSSGTVKVSHA